MILLLLSCSQRASDAEQVHPQPGTLPRHDIRHVEICALLKKPSAQDRLYFLHKINREGVDAGAELVGDNDSLMRCAEARLALPPGQDGIRVDMDWMPRGEQVEIDEMRIFAHSPHRLDDPYAVARLEPAPFQDFIFYVNLTTPALDDVSTIYLPPTL